MAALHFERNILQLCMKERLMLTTTFVRGSRYSREFIKNDINQGDIDDQAFLIWQESNKRRQSVMAADTDQSNFANYSEMVVHFQNMIMEHGKKAVTRDLVNRAFEKVKRIQLDKYHKASAEEKQSIELNPYKIFHQAIENGRPVLHTRKIWKSGIYYAVPEVCNPDRQLFYAMKWLGEAGIKKDKNVRFYDQLGQEIVNLYNQQGYVIRKKQDLHRLCETNKAFAQIKWKRGKKK